ncbi:MAG: hypothetical protein ACYSWU_02590 [Planctomycetota bacterium]
MFKSPGALVETKMDAQLEKLIDQQVKTLPGDDIGDADIKTEIEPARRSDGRAAPGKRCQKQAEVTR